MTRAARAGLAAATLSALAACADLTIERPVDAIRTPIANPSLARDIQPILTETCASSNACHAGPTPQRGLSLVAGQSYGDLIGVPAVLAPSLLRVKPFQPDSSYLILILGDDQTARQGARRMPLTTYPLPDPVIQTVRNWIGNGARNN